MWNIFMLDGLTLENVKDLPVNEQEEILKLLGQLEEAQRKEAQHISLVS